MIHDTTLTGCRCCKRGYPPAEMFFLPRLTLCPECIAELVTQMDLHSSRWVDYVLTEVREIEKRKP